MYLYQWHMDRDASNRQSPQRSVFYETERRGRRSDGTGGRRRGRRRCGVARPWPTASPARSRRARRWPSGGTAGGSRGDAGQPRGLPDPVLRAAVRGRRPLALRQLGHAAAQLLPPGVDVRVLPRAGAALPRADRGGNCMEAVAGDGVHRPVHPDEHVGRGDPRRVPGRTAVQLRQDRPHDRDHPLYVRHHGLVAPAATRCRSTRSYAAGAARPRPRPAASTAGRCGWPGC